MLKKKFIVSMKEKLLLEKGILLKKLNSTSDIDSDGDDTDAIQAHILLDLQQRFAGMNNQKLSSIDEAIRKIDDNSYGVCTDCEEDISEKRLLANPYFITCISCAEAREVDEKQRKKQVY
jgi:DnaK suppressor protein